MTKDGQRALECYYCEGSFSEEQHLQLHIAAVHEGKNITETLQNFENPITKEIYTLHGKTVKKEIHTTSQKT